MRIATLCESLGGGGVIALELGFSRSVSLVEHFD